jgi:hypothetical protein
MAPVTSKFLLTNTWWGQRILIMWTAYEPSLNFSMRLTVPPGYLTSAPALAFACCLSRDDRSRSGTPVLRDLTFDSLVRARLRQTLCAKHACDEIKVDDCEHRDCERDGRFPGTDRSGEFSKKHCQHSFLVQAADFAAGIAREIWHRNSLPHLVAAGSNTAHAGWLTSEKVRLSEARITVREFVERRFQPEQAWHRK